jgi:putative component of toxin-antitoxin plasmid stabilization module
VLRGSEAPRDPAIQARIVALKTVATYNLALADLAEGKSETEIAGRIEELTGLVGDVVSLAPIPFGKLAAFASGPVVETFKQFVTRLERAQASATIRQSILTESGTVDQIIDLLIADTGKMYDVYYIFQGDIAVHQPAAADRKREADRISKFHESLTAYVQLLTQSKQSLASLRKAAQEQTGSITNVRAVIVEATEIRRAAENFWNAVRELHQ